jgi:hypothetical protein
MTRPKHDWLPLGDRADHYLRPSTLYALNRIVHELLDEVGLGRKVVVVPSAYVPSDRTWQLDCVLPETWKATTRQAKRALERGFEDCCWFMTKVALNEALFQAFDCQYPSAGSSTGNLPDSLRRMQSFKDALQREFADEDGRPKDGLPADISKVDFSPTAGMDEEKKLYDAFLASKAAQDVSLARVSAIWQEIWNGDSAGEALVAEAALLSDTLALVERLPIDRRAFFPGVVYQALHNREKLSHPFRFAVARPAGGDKPFSHHLDVFKHAKRKAEAERRSATYDQFPSGQCVDYSLPFAAMYPTYLRATLDRFQLTPDVLCLPIYTNWVGEENFGFLCAHVQCSFAGRHDPARIGLRLHRQCEQITNEVAQAALAHIAELPIEPPYDLVEHFVRCIVHLQDWERVWVYRGQELQYCYSRRYSFGQTDSDCPNAPKWKSCDCSSGEQCNCVESDIDGSMRLRWPDDKSFRFWSTGLLPDLTEEERRAFEAVQLVFEYPKTAVLPDARRQPALYRRFEYSVIENQLEVMRALIPKVRARRAALRNATSAIMGRNMSHNIGSHVLARYSSRVADDRSKTASGQADHRGEFLRYLQRRMDFIAELATKDRAMWSQPLGIRQTAARLDFDVQQKRVGQDPKHPRVPILLTHISGKETDRGPVVGNVNVEATKDGPPEWYFDCAGGEVGAHALYVILENMIRNSARHSWQALPKTISINVRVTECSEHPDYWVLMLIDEHSAYRKEYEEEENDPVAEIRRLLNQPAILDENGALDPKNWGLREMQICATYLRKLPLSDLEGRPRKPSVLEALWFEERGKKCLAYKLYLPRARIALFVRADRQHAKETRQLPSGFSVVTAESAADIAELPREAHGYAFVVLQDSLVDVTTPLSAWPVRTFRKTGEAIKALLDGLANAEDALDWADRWLHGETLHRYLAARAAWNGATCPKVLVRWVDSGSPPITSGDPQIQHVRTLDDALKWQNENANSEHGVIGLGWFDHPKFGDTGETLDTVGIGYKDASRQTKKKPRFEFVEGFRGISPHLPALAGLRAGRAPHNELVAAALARVIVLDERFQAEAGEGWGSSGLTYQQCWAMSGIWVPRKGAVNLDEPKRDEIRSFLCCPVEAARQYPADFLVVHLTILEKLKREKEQLTEPQIIEAFRQQDGVGKKCQVVIVTGRGMATIAEQASLVPGLQHRFLPISAIHEYLVGNTSKLMLMRALWSAAAPTGEKEVRR